MTNVQEIESICFLGNKRKLIYWLLLYRVVRLVKL